MRKRFAVVMDWENSASAEAECVRWFKYAAEILGLACDVVDTQYRFIDNRQLRVSKQTHDFVLHVHFFSGKAENVFSIATLWNPHDIHHNWGYRQSVSTLMTNDDFVFEGSSQVTSQMYRLIKGSTYHLFPEILMFPSPPKIIHLPLFMEERRLFYSGINWERLRGTKGRFHDLLKALDRTGLIDIYGPEHFQGIRPWRGFHSYRGEIPFDGISMMDYLQKSGIALVLSSASHINDEIITNRLFEALAAGVVVIADQNPIVKELMGETCLYVNTDSSDCEQQIIKHVNWLNEHPQEAFELAKASQAIFEEKLCLCMRLASLYSKLSDRKRAIIESRIPDFCYSLNVFYICNEDGLGFEKNFELILKSVTANRSANIHSYLLSSREINEKEGNLFSKVIIRKEQSCYGSFVHDAIKNTESADFYAFVLPGEELFDNHFESVIKSIHDQGTQLGCSDIILKVLKPDAVTFQGQLTLDYLKTNVSCGSFVFCSELLSESRMCALRQMHYGFVYSLIVGIMEIAQSRGFTCKIHQKVARLQKDIEIVEDLRLRDWFELLVSKTPMEGVVQEITNENSVFRKLYNKYYIKIVWLRRYPKFWNFCKALIKPFM